MRAAVIGVGRMGVRHVQALQKLGADVCGISDISPATLASAASDLGLAEGACFNDAVAMLQEVRPEAVVVSTTAPTHAAYVTAAAEAGVQYILCEKPMATSLAEVEAMRASCERAGARLAINHQMRFMPQYANVKTLIGDDSDLGALASILVAGSNFGLAMNASHYFEMFRFITDTPVERLQAWFESGQLPNPRGPQFDDRSGRVLALNDSGVSLYIDFSRAAGHGLQVIYICRNGQIVVDELTGEVRVTVRKPEHRGLPTSRYAMPAEVRTFSIEGADTVAPTMKVWSALLEGGSYPDGSVGEHAIACLVAAHVSNERSAMVRINDLKPVRDVKFGWA